jgi:hypothetical protein
LPSSSLAKEPMSLSPTLLRKRKSESYFFLLHADGV